MAACRAGHVDTASSLCQAGFDLNRLHQSERFELLNDIAKSCPSREMMALIHNTSMKKPFQAYEWTTAFQFSGSEDDEATLCLATLAGSNATDALEYLSTSDTTTWQSKDIMLAAIQASCAAGAVDALNFFIHKTQQADAYVRLCKVCYMLKHLTLLLDAIQA